MPDTLRQPPRPTAPRRHARQAARSLGAAAALCALLAGCGSSSGSGSASAGADPATAAPASAPLYLSATLRPSGSLKDDTVAVARKLSHQQDPFGRLIASLQRSSHGHVDYQRDIKPWLGDRVGAFFTTFGSSHASGGGLLGKGLSAGSSFGSGTQGALIADTSDTGKARSFLDSEARRNHSHSASYRGVSYQVQSDGTAEGIVGKFAVVGSEGGLHAVADTVRGGPSLAASSDFAHARSGIDHHAVGDVYVNFNGLLDAVHAQGRSAQTLAAVRQLLASSGAQSVDVALVVPSSGSLGFEARETTTTAASTPASTGAGVLAALPADSWLALGIGDLGGTVSKLLNDIAKLGQFGGVDVGASIRSLNDRAGFNIQRDLLDWIGGTGIFISGTALTNLNVALVIDSKDPARSKAAVARIGRLLSGPGARVRPLSLPGTDAGIAVQPRKVPVTIDIVNAQRKFVIGLGDASVQAALHPSGTLSGAPVYSEAQSLLGGGIKPSFLLSFPRLLALLEGLGVGQSPGFAKTKPYLQSLGTLTAGAQRQGDIWRGRLVLAVH